MTEPRWDDRLEKVDEFEVSLASFEELIGEGIRLRWPDLWGDAYYQGTVTDIDQSDYPDLGPCIDIELLVEGGQIIGLALPVGLVLDLWVVV